MRILLFTPHNPVPPHSGAHQRMLEMLIGLRELGARIHLAGWIDFSENPWSDQSCAWLRDNGLCTELSVFSGGRSFVSKVRVRAWRELRQGWARLQNHSDPPPPHMNLTSPAMRKWFAALIEKESPDRILVNYASFASLLFASNRGATPRSILDAHDLLSLNRRMRGTLEPFLGDGPVFRVESMAAEALDLGFYDSPRLTAHASEFASIDRFDVTLAITEADASAMRAKTRHTQVLAAPTPAAPAAARPEHGALALFPMGPHPFNLQGYAWFLRKVLPLICAQCPEFRLGVTGILYRHLTLECHPHVRNFGFVGSPEELWKLGRILVNPVFGGTGQPIKTIEAMAAGIPPVILERFAHAVPVIHGVNGFVAKTHTEFASYCIQLWNDANLCWTMGAAAMEAVRRHCSREIFAGQLQQALNA